MFAYFHPIQEVASIARWDDEQIEYIKERVTKEGRQEDIKRGKEPAQVKPETVLDPYCVVLVHISLSPFGSVCFSVFTPSVVYRLLWMKQLSCWIWLLWKAPGMTIWSGLLNVIRKLGSMKLPNLCYTEIELKLILAYAYLAFMYISNFVICCRLQFWNYV